MEIVLLIVLFGLIFIFSLYKVKIKGIIGEKTVSLILNLLDKSDYKIINNILLKSGEFTTQIDHVVISSFGIFVIETKNYKGWIIGYENSEYWTQVLYKYKKKFYNPIRQNSGHIRALKSCLKEYPDLEYKSIIVFSTKAEIKIDTKIDVINVYNLTRTIKNYSTINLSQTDKDNVFQKINAANLIDSFSRRKHVSSIKQRMIHREKTIQEKKCPRCGNNLAVRKGEYGSFFGCKSYPRCKFTQKI
ncbi:nuclease-related domain-containing protein [Flavobacterium notoginsengisoli]|uniref:nuclease-related domain-containing protein n=1 Tax=Flavobacterium notoginsengisoli TaxID=1478199 RepID=UPI00362609B1